MGSVARCFGKVVTLVPGHDSPFETDLFRVAASACGRAGGRDGDLASGSLTAAVRRASQFFLSWRIKEVYLPLFLPQHALSSILFCPKHLLEWYFLTCSCLLNTTPEVPLFPFFSLEVLNVEPSASSTELLQC